MKKMLFSALVATTLFSSCSTAYQTGQTPDDVYFSPGQEREATVNRRDQENEERYQEYVSTMDDRYLRMRVANRDRWSRIDNFSYWNDMRYDHFAMNFNSFYNFNPWLMDPFMFNANPWNIGLGFRPGFNAWNNCVFGWGGGFNNGWRNGWNSGWGGGWNMNNPFFTLVNFANPKAAPPAYSSGANLNAFRNRTFNNSNNAKGNWYAPGGANGSSNNFSNLVKRVFSNSGNNSNGASNSYDRSIRTFSGNSPSSSSVPATSSSAGGASGGFKSTGSSASSGRGGRN